MPTTTHSRETLLGLAAGLCVLLVFSSNLVVSRIGAINTLTVYDVSALRFGVGALCAAPFLLRVRPVNLTWRRAVVLAVLSGALFVNLMVGGFVFAPVAHGGIVINGGMPVFAALFSWLIFGEGLGRWRIAGVALIVVGVAATSWDALTYGVPGQWRGHLLFLGAAACNSGFLTAVRGWRIGARESLIAVLGLNALVYLPLWWFFLPSNILVAPWQEIALQAVFHGLIAAFLAGMLIAYAARTLGSTRQAAIMSGAPALGLLLAIPILDEIPSWISGAGVAIVTGGILVTVGPNLLRQAAPAATPGPPRR